MTLCPKHVNQNMLKLPSLIASEVLKRHWNIFGHFRQGLEVFQKSLEVTGTFSEIPAITRQKSHAFDSKSWQVYQTILPPKKSPPRS